MDEPPNIELSAQTRRLIAERLTALAAQHCSPADAVASWHAQDGSLNVNAAGYELLSQIVEDLRKVKDLETYPTEYLRTIIAKATISFQNESLRAVLDIESTLDSEFRLAKAFVPFWGLHFAQDVHLEFGPYKMRRLGDDGFEDEILVPFRAMRASLSEAEIERDVASVSKNFGHVANVPTLEIRYKGSKEGAEDFVAPVARRIADFLQFLIYPVVYRRNDIRIIDHRGAYFGRFSTAMPVLSYDPKTETLETLGSPNIRGNPYVPTLTADVVERAESLGIMEVLNHVPAGPSGGESVDDLLLRAIQLFADGERAITPRQAIVSYVGACEAFFHCNRRATKHTCTGMALVIGGNDFDAAYKLARQLYTERSDAAHEGLEPDSTDTARQVAYATITHISKNRANLPTLKAIRDWLKRFLPA